MTGTYQSNYKEQGLSNSGREILITDGVMNYAYDLAEGDEINDAIDSFVQTASYDRDTDCIAYEYRNGEQIGSVTFAVAASE